jgi:cytochrome c oxidase cbb3-type subunit IV
MDINDLRSVLTVVSMLLFVAVAVWTWQRARRDAFDEAARLPFMDEGAEPSKGEQQ